MVVELFNALILGHHGGVWGVFVIDNGGGIEAVSKLFELRHLAGYVKGLGFFAGADAHAVIGCFFIVGL